MNPPGYFAEVAASAFMTLAESVLPVVCALIGPCATAVVAAEVTGLSGSLAGMVCDCTGCVSVALGTYPAGQGAVSPFT